MTPTTFCKPCLKYFKHEEALKHHNARVHVEKYKVPQINCPICDLELPDNQRILKTHLRAYHS